MYQHPGVYIEHVPSNALAIEAASTSVTAIIGNTRRGTPVKKGGGDPVFISSVGQYVSKFGPADGSGGGVKDLGVAADAMGLAVNAYFANGGGKAYIVPIFGSDAVQATASLQLKGGANPETVELTFKDAGEWPNGLLVHIGPGTTTTADDKVYTLTIGTSKPDPEDAAVKLLDEVLEEYVNVSFSADKPNFITDVVNGNSNLVTVALTGAPDPAQNKTVQVEVAAGADGGAPGDADLTAALAVLEDYRDVSILILPDFEAAAGKTALQLAITHCEKMQNRMVIVDPEDKDIPSPADAKTAVFSNSPYAALYHPYVLQPNPHFDAETNPGVPQSFRRGPAAIAAGMWARIDGTRGVWKAPAGLEAGVRGTLGPTRLIGNALQDNLNEWGVNCLRSIVGPMVIWGARTMATKAKPQYRYISVRRTQNMIGESLYNALQAVVFEPNDHKLWGGLRASVGNFMDGLHRAGAFQGEKASDAYFVNCGLGSTMTQGDIDAGIVRVAVGFAPLKPAEFVVVQISQKVGQSA